MMSDQEKRKKLVWEIDKKLQEDGARPIIFPRAPATCMQPQVKGLTMMVNSIYNGWRMEDVWLDKCFACSPGCALRTRNPHIGGISGRAPLSCGRPVTQRLQTRPAAASE